MKFCSSCGKEIVEPSKFCSGCGIALDSSPTTEAIGKQTDNSMAAKVLAVGSAIGLAVMFFIKWFTIPILDFVLYFMSNFFGIDIGNNGYSFLDLFMTVFKMMEQGNSNPEPEITAIFVFAFIISVMSAISVITLIVFIYNVLKNYTEQIISSYKNSLSLTIATCSLAFIGVLIINIAASNEVGIDLNFISLKPAFYIAAIIALVSRVFILKMLADLYQPIDYTS